MLRNTSHLTTRRLWAAALCAVLIAACAGCSRDAAPSSQDTSTVVVSEESAQDSEATAADEGATNEGTADVATLQDTQPEEDAQGASEASDQEDYVLSGTCSVLTAEELLKLQEIDTDPYSLGYEPDDRFALILLDGTQTLYSHAPGEPDLMTYQDADMLLVASVTRHSAGDIAQWEPYNGMHVTVQVSPYDIWNPSDVRLPVGQPRADNVVLVSAE